MHPKVDDGIVAHAAHGHEIAKEEDVSIVERIQPVALVMIERLELVENAFGSCLSRVVLAVDNVTDQGTVRRR